jgi:hypothetical protein
MKTADSDQCGLKTQLSQLSKADAQYSPRSSIISGILVSPSARFLISFKAFLDCMRARFAMWNQQVSYNQLPHVEF